MTIPENSQKLLPNGIWYSWMSYPGSTFWKKYLQVNPESSLLLMDFVNSLSTKHVSRVLVQLKKLLKFSYLPKCNFFCRILSGIIDERNWTDQSGQSCQWLENQFVFLSLSMVVVCWYQDFYFYVVWDQRSGIKTFLTGNVMVPGQLPWPRTWDLCQPWKAKCQVFCRVSKVSKVGG